MNLKEITLKNAVKVLDSNKANQIKGGRIGNRRKRPKPTPITLPSGGGTPPPIMAIEIAGN